MKLASLRTKFRDLNSQSDAKLWYEGFHACQPCTGEQILWPLNTKTLIKLDLITLSTIRASTKIEDTNSPELDFIS